MFNFVSLEKRGRGGRESWILMMFVPDGRRFYAGEGDAALVDDLYDTYYDELVVWADAILGDVEAAEDVVQDFFVYLWEKGTVERLRREEARAYLYAGVKHL